ncbi:hypothetical protein A2924_01120 [Candidatus Giovannonibacteria bacterium RIFCSPLOWO2_01_FULL_44_16]|uniref:Uncharacterized protein n=1 Tax=Candidatus Giovannonibacteria bacterium RIFCSPLOWO2_01_FULL_44_16 TaxID=1798348 RepID=A0A1F5X450_9BACT|nr:MAG: hypothetical protein A2924_01120 [Candidatus Giovannonibacteria bacterium RIFCSPLOWO2_01_FULL_44_16]
MTEKITNQEQSIWSAEKAKVEEFESKAKALLEQMQSFNSEAQELYNVLKQTGVEHLEKFKSDKGDSKKDINDSVDLQDLRFRVADKVSEIEKFKFHVDL